MKKEEIIKNLISSEISLPVGILKRYAGPTEYYDLTTRKLAIVDLDKLAKLLAKYIVKEDLIED